MIHNYKDTMPEYPQGEPGFVELLKRHIPFIPHWEENEPCENELDLKPGAVLRIDFPDPEKLLETAYADFNRFLSEAKLNGDIVPIRVKHLPGMEWESYRLTIDAQSVTLEASDTEGIRMDWFREAGWRRKHIFIADGRKILPPFLQMNSTFKWRC